MSFMISAGTALKLQGTSTLCQAMRAVISGMLLVLAALAAAVAPASARLAPERPRPLEFLHVGPAGGPAGLRQVLDASGRQVLLKGVNVDGIVDYFRTDLRTPYPTDPAAYANGACPPDDRTVEGVRVCDFDFAQMRPLGYDAIRLNLSWSLLEPQPGKIDGQYLDRIAQVVAWAKAQGIYTVLDLHQDAWSKYVYSTPSDPCSGRLQSTPGYDGAPLWASAHVTPACALNGTRELDSAVAEDFQRLWSDAPAPDGRGLQEHYADVVIALARRFHDDPAVAGYEIINEPNPGFAAVPAAMDASELFPFYGKVVNEVVATVPRFRQLFFVEPNVERNVTDQREVVTPWSIYSSYPNVVYAPHVYTGVFTADQEAAGMRFLPPQGGYATAIDDAKTLRLPLWVGEFGNNPSDDDTILRTHYELQDQFGLGGSLWLWKENANDTNPSFFWGVYGPPFGTGTPQPKRIAYTARAYPLYVAGNLQQLRYTPADHSFEMQASSHRVRCGDTAHATLVFLPPGLTAPIVAQGARLAVFSRGDGAREAYVYPNGGSYSVRAMRSGDPSWAPAVASRCLP
jgi:endoglycosylceramidase